MRHLWIKLICGLSAILSTAILATIAIAAPLSLSQIPLIVNQSVPPLTMLVISKDHTLYFPAYNDASDVNGDGNIDIQFDPKIDYYGYFDSYKCYSYDAVGMHFFPIAVTATKTCSGAWSGNFLNYLTMSRMDTIRKVLYGGLRSNDSATQTVLERSYIPQDGHSWGKEYQSAAINGYEISSYTPYSAPGSGSYLLFANTTLRNGGGDKPLLRVANNQPYRIWDWVGIDKPVADSRALNGTTGPLINGITDFVVRVKVCDSVVGTETNCRIYPNGQYKPIGLLQEFGENDSMHFGLLTGSYVNNLQGGVLRKTVSSFKDEVDLTTGQFTTFNGIVSTLNRLTVVNFGADYTYSDCGFFYNRQMSNGECEMWGNPLAEMMYESTRYFAGKNAPTSSFTYSSGADVGLGLAKPNWNNPYTVYPYCSKASMLVLSSIYPSYDSDNIEGSYFSSFSGDLTGLSAADLGQKIYSAEGYGAILAFIGQSAGDANNAPTAKTVTSFGNIRGLAPHEPGSEGSYYSASIAWYALLTDLNGIKDTQNLRTYVVGLSSAQPDFKFKARDGIVRVVPFGKSVGSLSPLYPLSPLEKDFQPTNEIVNYFIESYTSTGAVFRVNFSNMQQGGDFEMDNAVLYTITVNGDGTVTVNIEALANTPEDVIMHMGYVLSGTTEDGIYLAVRGANTPELLDIDYYLDTPVGEAPDGNWEDKLPLPLVSNRTFKPSGTGTGVYLENPLWYAAKWGGFVDSNDSDTPDLSTEWDTDNNGIPDNYFFINNAANLGKQLSAVLAKIIDETSSYSTAALSSGFLNSNTQIFQAVFRTLDWSGELLAFKIDSANGNILTTGSGPQGSQWDAAEVLDTQNYNSGRNILTYKRSSSKGIPFRWPSNPASPGATELDLTNVVYLNTSPVTALIDGLGQKRLNYIRGNHSDESQNGGSFRNRDFVLGDIINSTPILVGDPIQAYPFVWLDGAPENNSSYYTFKQNNLTRTEVVYTGANDGMLHAFNATTGKELFAYVPEKIIQTLPLLTSQNYTHQFYVDGPVTIIDAYLNAQWKTILVGGLNGGGQAIYALNVTDPASFTEANAASIVMWEFTDVDDKDLGYTYSQPIIVRMANGKWAAVFGNGYNNTIGDGNVSTTGNAVLYVVDLETKAIIAKFDTKVGTAQDPLATGRPNGMSSPIALDKDGNSIADVIYAGDLFGNVWKIDVSNTNPNQWDFSFKSGSNPAPLFVAKDASSNRQSITSKPAISSIKYDQSEYMIFIGTGKFLEYSDKLDLSIQTVYAIKDSNTTAISGRASLKQQTIIAQTSEYRVTSSDLLSNSDRGWYLDLIFNNTAEGERVISDMTYINGKIIFATAIPSTDPCAYGGSSWLMELNGLTGARLSYNVFDRNGDGTYDSSDNLTYTSNSSNKSAVISGMKSSVGLTSAPAILNAGSKEYKYLAGTSGSIQKVNENPGGHVSGRKSWRQLR